jgi:hypothetical protein
MWQHVHTERHAEEQLAFNICLACRHFWLCCSEKAISLSAAAAAAAAAADYTNGVEGFSYNYYEDLTPKDACDIIDTLRKGEQKLQFYSFIIP